MCSLESKNMQTVGTTGRPQDYRTLSYIFRLPNPRKWWNFIDGGSPTRLPRTSTPMVYRLTFSDQGRISTVKRRQNLVILKGTLDQQISALDHIGLHQNSQTWNTSSNFYWTFCYALWGNFDSSVHNTYCFYGRCIELKVHIYGEVHPDTRNIIGYERGYQKDHFCTRIILLAQTMHRNLTIC